MARNEKKAARPTMSLLFIAFGCIFVVGAGYGFIWNKSQIHSLGQQIRYYETRLDEAKRRRLTLERAYATMCSPVDLEDRVKRMKLELGPPQPDQIVRLPETPPDAIAPDEKILARGLPIAK